jgi:hypothetical protein
MVVTMFAATTVGVFTMTSVEFGVAVVCVAATVVATVVGAVVAAGVAAVVGGAVVGTGVCSVVITVVGTVVAVVGVSDGCVQPLIMTNVTSSTKNPINHFI